MSQLVFGHPRVRHYTCAEGEGHIICINDKNSNKPHALMHLMTKTKTKINADSNQNSSQHPLFTKRQHTSTHAWQAPDLNFGRCRARDFASLGFHFLIYRKMMIVLFQKVKLWHKLMNRVHSSQCLAACSPQNTGSSFLSVAFICSQHRWPSGQLLGRLCGRHRESVG